MGTWGIWEIGEIMEIREIGEIGEIEGISYANKIITELQFNDNLMTI